MRYIVGVYVLLITSVLPAYSQIYGVDALTFTHQDIQGTARTLGTAGAFSAVGGDPGALFYNPAALGMMRGSQVFLTPELKTNSESFTFLNNNGSSSRVSVPWGYSGAVISSNSVEGWNDGAGKRTNYAFFFTRTADFNQQRSFSAINPDNSITYSYVDEFNQEGASLSDNILNNPAVNPFNEFTFESVLAWQAYLANYDSAFNSFFSPVEAAVAQNGHYKTSGGIYEIHFMTSGNTKDEKLYYGFGGSIPILRFESETFFQEDDYQNGNPQFDQMSVITDYRTSGPGFKFNFGLLYRPVRLARFSFYMHSPTFFGLSERYQSRLTSRVNLPESPQSAYAVESPSQEFNYSFRTPWRFGFGTAIFIKKLGFVSLDYEFADFGSANYDFGSNFTSFNEQVNQPIKTTYRFNHQVRLGTEFALKRFRIRGGMAFQTSPFLKSFNLPSEGDLMRLTFSTGFGYVWKNFNLDFAYIATRSDEFYQPYSIVFGQAPFATLSYVERRIALTASLKF